jgi:hypothetical protein
MIERKQETPIDEHNFNDFLLQYVDTVSFLQLKMTDGTNYVPRAARVVIMTGVMNVRNAMAFRT